MFLLYAGELKLSGNYLCVKIHVSSGIFIFWHVCTLEMGAIYVFGPFFPPSTCPLNKPKLN